jgi:hypothetical protein
LVSSLCSGKFEPSFTQLFMPTLDLTAGSATIDHAILGAAPTSAQAAALSIYRILADILDQPVYMTKLVASLPLHRIILAIMSSNPLPQTVALSFSIVKAAIQNTAPDLFEKSFTSEVSAAC